MGLHNSPYMIAILYLIAIMYGVMAIINFEAVATAAEKLGTAGTTASEYQLGEFKRKGELSRSSSKPASQ
jgi:hypothetical protein